MSTYYVTTPIYYVNDRPHLGHLYSTTLADIIARFHRLRGDDVFFLTGVDEHAAKVEEAAAVRGLAPRAWADENAAHFRDAFREFGLTNDDFVRTSDERHTSRVAEYVETLVGSGDVYRGTYEGWYDPGQEEYVPDHRASELQYRSPFSGRPLERRTETNYFFKLSRFQERLETLLSSGEFVRPDARRLEALARVSDGLNDIPISRSGGTWGIPVPGDASHTIYVWIDALFNYLSHVDTEARRKYWPADVHIIGKDILWFHAVIWPALLLALDRPLPRQVYVHSLWLKDGQKMSKSLGNFVGGDTLRRYVERFTLDGLRWFFATAGPIGAADAEFADRLMLDTYNADLANALGNCVSRVTNMIGRYFDGSLPAPAERSPSEPLRDHALDRATRAVDAYRACRTDEACAHAIDIVREIDREIERRRPFALAQDPARRSELEDVLYTCAEALRIVSVLVWPVIPSASQELWRRLGCAEYDRQLQKEHGRLEQWIRWGGSKPGVKITAGAALFPRVALSKSV